MRMVSSPTPRSQAPKSLALAAILVVAAAPGRSAVAGFEWHAYGKVERSGRSLDVAYSGVSSAADEPKALAEARAKVARDLTRDYPGYRLVPDSLVVRVDAVPSGFGDDSVSLRLVLTCLRPLTENENVLTVFNQQIASKEKVVADTFRVQVTATVDGEDTLKQGTVRSIGRGGAPAETVLSILAWQGEVLDDPVDVRVKIVSEGGGRTLETGVLTAKIRSGEGHLSVEWLPVESATLQKQDSSGPGPTSHWRLDGGGVPFSVWAGASRASEVASYFQARGEELRQKANAFEKKLNSAGERVKVMNGFVQADAIDTFGNRVQLLSGGIFVITADAAAGQAYQERVFGRRNDVHLVRDEDEARAFLDRQWSHAKQTIFSKQRILEDTVKVTFTPKTGYTVQEQVRDLPPRRRR